MGGLGESSLGTDKPLEVSKSLTDCRIVGCHLPGPEHCRDDERRDPWLFAIAGPTAVSPLARPQEAHRLKRYGVPP